MENIIEWIIANPYLSLTIAISVAEFVTRITPTKIDDGFVQRVGKLIKLILDTINFPNVLKDSDIKL